MTKRQPIASKRWWAPIRILWAMLALWLSIAMVVYIILDME